MKKEIVQIDINKLTVEQLENLRAIMYDSQDWSSNGYFNSMKAIQEREAFLKGWMSEEKEKAYLEKIML